ncbi:Mariner Mos1 transposase [Eumeta japonica]|uniref:Mariner Mos1 transposase n=1 Tax=Eumeta variegata TaxID=151549 RepID=A0A4C1TWG5_EUMVA|nr:Mariner Mos1 transposase [Eumeta japonica]
MLHLFSKSISRASRLLQNRRRCKTLDLGCRREARVDIEMPHLRGKDRSDERRRWEKWASGRFTHCVKAAAEAANSHVYSKTKITVEGKKNDQKTKRTHEAAGLEEDSSQTQKELALTLEVAVPVKNYLKTLDWEVLPHPPYSPDIAPSDYHLFRSMAHALSEQRSTLYEDTKNWVDSWIASKDKEFFRLGIPDRCLKYGRK